MGAMQSFLVQITDWKKGRISLFGGKEPQAAVFNVTN